MTDEASVSTEEQTDPQGGDPTGDTGDAEIDISTIPVEKLLSHPEIQKQLQSMTDKQAARIERQFNDRQKAASAAATRLAEQRELQALADTGDYSTLGERTAAGIQRNAQLTEAAKEVTAVMQDLIRQKPEFQELGEEAFTKAVASVQDRGGNVLDLMSELSQARMERELTKQVQAATDKMSAEMDARFAEYGVEKRTKAADAGDGPSPSISRGKGVSANTASDDDLLTAYGNGEDVPADKVRAILAERGIKL